MVSDSTVALIKQLPARGLQIINVSRIAWRSSLRDNLVLKSQKNWILLLSEPLRLGSQEGVTFFGSHLAQERERRAS